MPTQCFGGGDLLVVKSSLKAFVTILPFHDSKYYNGTSVSPL
jgi:hypothetical protein